MPTLILAVALAVAASEVGIAQCGWVLWSKADPGVQQGKPALNQPDTWTVYDGYADI
jgi:hypothetical protein